MRTNASRNRTIRDRLQSLPFFACALAAVVFGAGVVRAQEGDLSGSAGVFIEPRRAKETAPRERAAPTRTTPRRARTKASSPNTPASNAKPTGLMIA